MEKVRLDKWLWAARFFKTRALATEAINGGKIHVDGQRSKPSRNLQTGQAVRISKGETVMTVVVEQLSDKRGPASEAQKLYHETDESREKREAFAAMRKAERIALQGEKPARRPNKKQRRHIIRFKQDHSG